MGVSNPPPALAASIGCTAGPAAGVPGVLYIVTEVGTSVAWVIAPLLPFVPGFAGILSRASSRYPIATTASSSTYAVIMAEVGGLALLLATPWTAGPM